MHLAIEVQHGMIERNAGVRWPSARIEFRIGMLGSPGDVVEESDGDLMGDGVNIAARVRGLAKPWRRFCLFRRRLPPCKSEARFRRSPISGPTGSLRRTLAPSRCGSISLRSASCARPSARSCPVCALAWCDPSRRAPLDRRAAARSPISAATLEQEHFVDRR